MTISTAKFQSLTKRDLDNIFHNQLSEFKSYLPDIFTREVPKARLVNSQLISDIDTPALWDGQIYYGEAEETYSKTLAPLKYSLGFKVDNDMSRFDLYNQTKMITKQTARKMKMQKERIGASILTGAFDTSLVADGLSLCNTAHTSYVGGSNQGNSGTSALSSAAIEATRLLGSKMQTDKDDIDPIDYDTIIINSDNEETLWEILHTSGKLGTANNDLNFNKGKYKIIVWRNFLNEGDWFMCDSRLMKEYFKFYEWQPITFIESADFDVQATKMASIMQNNAEAIDWKPIYGHNPA